MPYYSDLRDYINVLEAAGKLRRIKRPVNKDTELHPFVRCQFLGLKEEERTAFLFENVVDAKGRRYKMPVLIASHAPSRQVYAMGMMCSPEEIPDKWAHAIGHPLAPRVVSTSPLFEEIHSGQGLLEHGGLAEFPVPISTPGLDNAPYLTCANFVSKDPETGVANVGNYRAMVKGPDRLGINPGPTQHFREHWEMCRAKGIQMQAAVFIGATPNLGYVATAKVPYGIEEFAVAGAIAGQAIELVKCKTVDLQVPATAEIVIEGVVPTDFMEREGPFGEYTGYMGHETFNPYLEITSICHRREPIYNAFLSQFPPSESSKLRQIGDEAVFYKFLKHDCNIPGIIDVAIHESSGSAEYIVMRMKKTHPSQAWQALYAAAALIPNVGKIFIVVDEDIEPRDPGSVNWALSFRMQPHRDLKVIEGKVSGLDPSSAPPGDPDRKYPQPHGVSALLIDATRNWDYPPVSLPRKEYMVAAKKMWEEEGLPELNFTTPWHGYFLGQWTGENEEEAALAVQGEYFKTGEKLVQGRKKVR